MKRLMLVLAAVGALGLMAGACSEEKKAGGGGTAAKPAEGTAKPAEGDKKPEEKPAEPAAGGGGELGIPECDDYVKKYMACLDKLPEASKGAMQSGLDQMKSAWKDAMAAATTPEAKSAMGQGCKQAMDAAKQAMDSMCPGVW